MAIKFEFTLEDADAENLFGCISACIVMSNERLMEAIAEGNQSMQNVYRNDIAYLQNLKTKLLHVQVGE